MEVRGLTIREGDYKHGKEENLNELCLAVLKSDLLL